MMRHAALFTAAVLAGGVLASQAAAQPVGCAGDLEVTQRAVERAKDALAARKAFVNGVLAMSETQIRVEYERARTRMMQQRDAVRRAVPGAQQGLAEITARHDLLTEASTRALIGEKINPSRNAYTARIALAERELLGAQGNYTNVLAACVPSGGRPPQVAAQPPPRPVPRPAAVGSDFPPPAGGVKQARRRDFSPPPGSAEIDMSSWSGNYTDGRRMIYTGVGTYGVFNFNGANDAASLIINYQFGQCHGTPDHVWCDVYGFYTYGTQRTSRKENLLTFQGPAELTLKGGVLRVVQRVDRAFAESGVNPGVENDTEATLEVRRQ